MAADKEALEDIIPTVTLAKLYEKQGLLEDAASVYRKLLGLEPGQKALEDALEKIEKKLQGSKPKAKSGAAEAVLSHLNKWKRAVRLRQRHIDQRGVAKTKFLVICGSGGVSPGPAEREEVTPGDIESQIKHAAEESTVEAEVFWANNKESLHQRLLDAAGEYDALIIDPGKLPCTGQNMRDALASLDVPIIEVHPRNVFCEDISHTTGIADITTAHLAGFGKEGYAMAVRAAALMARSPRENLVHEQEKIMKDDMK